MEPAAGPGTSSGEAPHQGESVVPPSRGCDIPEEPLEPGKGLKARPRDRQPLAQSQNLHKMGKTESPNICTQASPKQVTLVCLSGEAGWGISTRKGAGGKRIRHQGVPWSRAERGHPEWAPHLGLSLFGARLGAREARNKQKQVAGAAEPCHRAPVVREHPGGKACLLSHRDVCPSPSSLVNGAGGEVGRGGRLGSS